MCSEEAVHSEEGLEEGVGELSVREAARAGCGGGGRHAIIQLIDSVGGSKERAARLAC